MQSETIDWVALRLLALRPRITSHILLQPDWADLLRDEASLIDLLSSLDIGRYSMAQLDGLYLRAEKVVDHLKALNCQIISLDAPQYPPLLKSIIDPPPVLFVRGDPAILSEPQVAIVGSRKSSSLGRATAENLAAGIVQVGLHVTSGLALGIDEYAHQGATKSELGTAQGKTIAVMATGPEQIYPVRNQRLAAKILERGGALITEQLPGTQARPFLFPERNRIISGLSLGTLVIEASIKSGSLVTAKLAAEQGREVMAVPGAITNSAIRGCHLLIKEGAALIESVDDVLAALHYRLREVVPPEQKTQLSKDPLLELISRESPTLDQLSQLTSKPISELQIQLTEYELSGLVQREGARFVSVR